MNNCIAIHVILFCVYNIDYVDYFSLFSELSVDSTCHLFVSPHLFAGILLLTGTFVGRNP